MKKKLEVTLITNCTGLPNYLDKFSSGLKVIVFGSSFIFI